MNSNRPNKGFDDGNYASIASAGTSRELKDRRIACQNELLEQLDLLPIEEWVFRVNAMHDAVARTAIRICEEQMIEAGHGPPPCAYAFIVFGSAGRREATLWSDQDNGLIVEGTADPQGQIYFSDFGSRLSAMLAETGYEKCDGKVMCSEPMWNRTLAQWKEQLARWASDPEWENVRYLTIASDMRHVAGEPELSSNWLEFFHGRFNGNGELIRAVLGNTVRHKATLNLLGQVLTERFGDHAGGFDVKYGIYIPLVNSVRHWSLRTGIRETSTLGRLEALEWREHELLPEGVRAAFLHALRLRAHTPYETNDEGLLTSSHYVSEKDLKNKTLLAELRGHLLLVRRIHRSLQRQLRAAERRQP